MWKTWTYYTFTITGQLYVTTLTAYMAERNVFLGLHKTYQNYYYSACPITTDAERTAFAKLRAFHTEHLSCIFLAQ